MYKSKRIAMFGGSFNPVHNAHILLAEKIHEYLSLDKIFAVPTYTTPLKDNTQMISCYHRLNMCRLAWQGRCDVDVDDVEIRRKGNSYTADTLAYFADKFIGAKLFLIVGADMFMTLQSWKNPEYIFKTAEIVTVPRNETHYESLLKQAEILKKSGAICTVLKDPIMILSSTEIRERLRRNIDVSGLMPQNVIDYIKTNNLYTERK